MVPLSVFITRKIEEVTCSQWIPDTPKTTEAYFTKAACSKLSAQILYLSRISNCRCGLLLRFERGDVESGSWGSLSRPACWPCWVDELGSEAVGSLIDLHFHFAWIRSWSDGQSFQTRWEDCPLHWMRYLPRCFGSAAALVPEAGFSLAQAEGLPP